MCWPPNATMGRQVSCTGPNELRPQFLANVCRLVLQADIDRQTGVFLSPDFRRNQRPGPAETDLPITAAEASTSQWASMSVLSGPKLPLLSVPLWPWHSLTSLVLLSYQNAMAKLLLFASFNYIYLCIHSLQFVIFKFEWIIPGKDTLLKINMLKVLF